MTLTYVDKMFTPRSHVMSGLPMIYIGRLSCLWQECVILPISTASSWCLKLHVPILITIMADNQTVQKKSATAIFRFGEMYLQTSIKFAVHLFYKLGSTELFRDLKLLLHH